MTSVKGKVCPRTGYESPEGEQRNISILFLTSALDGCGCSTSRPDRFTSGKDPVSIVYEAGWNQWPVWTGAENIAPHPTGIRSPGRPALSDSLTQQNCNIQEKLGQSGIWAFRSTGDTDR